MPNNDYILRSDAIRAFAGVPNDLYYTVGIVTALERIPAADVEPKRKWISVNQDKPKKTVNTLYCAIAIVMNVILWK